MRKGYIVLFVERFRKRLLETTVQIVHMKPSIFEYVQNLNGVTFVYVTANHKIYIFVFNIYYLIYFI